MSLLLTNTTNTQTHQHTNPQKPTRPHTLKLVLAVVLDFLVLDNASVVLLMVRTFGVTDSPLAGSSSFFPFLFVSLAQSFSPISPSPLLLTSYIPPAPTPLITIQPLLSISMANSLAVLPKALLILLITSLSIPIIFDLFSLQLLYFQSNWRARYLLFAHTVLSTAFLPHRFTLSGFK